MKHPTQWYQLIQGEKQNKQANKAAIKSCHAIKYPKSGREERGGETNHDINSSMSTFSASGF